MKKIFVYSLFFIFSYSLIAVLPPQVLKKSAISASEIIKIKVKSIKIESKTKYLKHIRVEAKVLDVKRTKTNLKKGDKITIEYSSKKLREGECGPKSNPILSKNQITAAFLYKNLKNNIYHIAARSNSFNNSIYDTMKKTKTIYKIKKSHTIKKVKK